MSRWSELAQDLDRLGSELVSVVAVTDPFGTYDVRDLRSAFDLVVPFKDHLMVDLAIPEVARVSRHHAKELRRASKEVQVRRCERPLAWLPDWLRLYSTLVSRHRISGPAAFASWSLARQLEVPGLEAYRAVVDGAVCAMALWYVMGQVAYLHLLASDDSGYRHGAAYPLLASALADLRTRGCAWANLGGAPGNHRAPRSGVFRFKQGWATGRRTAYLCGRILNHPAYERLVARSGNVRAGYFPAYRAAEAAASKVRDVPQREKG